MLSAAAGRPNTSGGFNTSSALMGLAAGAIGGAVLGWVWRRRNDAYGWDGNGWGRRYGYPNAFLPRFLPILWEDNVAGDEVAFGQECMHMTTRVGKAHTRAPPRAVP
ncbi:MAG: hypothetical protein FRX49_04357 [Trebouxia sp. A1-2]|nr:MAG: hypothetical protein FRX49_04357 [Trebouxia sp. A1-2]